MLYTIFIYLILNFKIVRSDMCDFSKTCFRNICLGLHFMINMIERFEKVCVNNLDPKTNPITGM